MKWYIGKLEEDSIPKFKKTRTDGGMFMNLVFVDDIVKGKDELGPGYDTKPEIPKNFHDFKVMTEYEAKRIILEWKLLHDC